MSHWCQNLYEANAPQLVLYGRALGLGHSEAEDVLQETFIALMERAEAPEQPQHYCLRAFRNRALNYKRSLWRRLTRELESHRWFERNAGEIRAIDVAGVDVFDRFGFQRPQHHVAARQSQRLRQRGTPGASTNHADALECHGYPRCEFVADT